MFVIVLEHFSVSFTETETSCICFFVYHINFTADVSIEAWQTADDIRESTSDEIQEDIAEPAALENAITISADGDDLESTDIVVSAEAVEISDDKLERKPEEELFVLLDDDLDNDIVSSHAAAFHRVDPQLDPAPVTTTSELLSPSKTSAGEGGAVKQTPEKTDVDNAYNTSNEDTTAAKTTSEKASPKRLVFG